MKLIRQTNAWLWALVLMCLPLVIAAAGVYCLVFYIGHAGASLVWLSGLSLILIAAIVGRSLGPIMFSLYGSGIFLIFVFMAGPAFLQSAILQVRGQTVSARVDRIVTDPGYPASTDDGCRSCSHTHGYVFRKSDGTLVRGYPYGSDKTLHIGDVRQVIIDPRGRIDSRSPREVRPIVNGIFLLVGTAIAYGICQSSYSAWYKRRTRV
jgi:hypothetical protein